VFDTVWMWKGRLHGFRIETDLADHIKALGAGQPYESPEWMKSNIYWDECPSCSNRPEIKLETLTRMVEDAIQSWEFALYI
jgi:hypothetical protein